MTIMKFIFPLFVALFSLTANAQQIDAVDFLTGKVDINVNAQIKEVQGQVTYTFKILKPTKSVYVDAQKMQINDVVLNEKKVNYTYDDKKIVVKADFAVASTNSITIRYKATPKKAMYFVKDEQQNDQIWTQGQGKYTSNWLPSFDDMNEKVEFDLTVTYKKGFEVIANGKLLEVTTVNDSLQKWRYDMQQPMSSYLVALVIGKYKKNIETAIEGTPLEMYFYEDNQDKYAPTYKHSKQLFDFLEKEIGFAYPWQNYKQIPVRDFLYAGMENTSATVFSDAFLIDETAYVDRNYISVNAHELAHQWFGDLVTATEGKHHWLQEGFATYYALLAEKEIFGEDYFLYKLYESAEQLTALSKTPQATSLLDPKASSLTFYQRGAWAIHALKNRIGETNFKITVHNYLQKYKFKNATTDNFFDVAKEVTGKDFTDFKKLWFENIQFPSQQALDILSKSVFIKKYLGLAQERTQPMAGKFGLLANALKFPVNDYIGQEVIYQLEGDASQEAIALYDNAFETNNIYIRQTIANTLNKIPQDLKSQYESLLQDPSYATIEPALYHLWSNFPEDRHKYLDATKAVIGFNDKNVRILWLVLALSTRDYHTKQHQKFYNELSGYTSPKFHFSTRENAFTYLESLQAFTDQSLKDLVDGAVHHNWRFRNSCRKILDKLLTVEKYKKKYVALKNNLSNEQQIYLAKKITP